GAADQIPQDRAAHASRSLTGPDHRDSLGCEKGIEGPSPWTEDVARRIGNGRRRKSALHTRLQVHGEYQSHAVCRMINIAAVTGHGHPHPGAKVGDMAQLLRSANGPASLSPMGSGMLVVIAAAKLVRRSQPAASLFPPEETFM